MINGIIFAVGLGLILDAAGIHLGFHGCMGCGFVGASLIGVLEARR